MHLRIVQGGSRLAERGLEQQNVQILERLVVLLLFGLLAQVHDYWMVEVDFEVFLADHVAHGGRVVEGQGLHDTLYFGGPAILSGSDITGQYTWEFAAGGSFTVSNDHSEPL